MFISLKNYLKTMLFSLSVDIHIQNHVANDKYNHNYLRSGHSLFSSLQRESFLLHFAAHLSPLHCATVRGCGCQHKCECGSKFGRRQSRRTTPPALPPAISFCARHPTSMRHCPASLHRRFSQVSRAELAKKRNVLARMKMHIG